MTEPPSPEEVFSDDAARDILRRAVEIEKDGQMSETRLREIAGEADINADAMNRAIAEAQAARQTAQQNSGEMQPMQQSYLSWQGWALVAAIVLFAMMFLIRL